MSKKTSAFYDKCSSMLVSIESCRSAGSLEPSIAKFTTLIDEITEFLEESEGEDDVDEDVEEEEEYCVMELIRMRGVASYQLALTALQLSDSHLADVYLNRLGFRTRLLTTIFAYHNLPKIVDKTSPLKVVNQILNASLFDALKKAFDEESNFWSYHKYPTNIFFSYNLSLTSPSKSLISQLVHTVYSRLDSEFEGLKKARSAEVWAHTRTGEGQHQFHYDLDEVALGKGKIKSPIISCVLYLEAGSSNPTLICDKKIAETKREPLKGWYCTPEQNRLIAFPGNLLHCVIPGIPDSVVGGRRTTVMIGFWEEVEVCDEDLGPNMVLKSQEWTNGMDVVEGGGVGEAVGGDVFCIDKCIEDVKFENDLQGVEEYDQYYDQDIGFTGRFFLREGLEDIDGEVLKGMGMAKPQGKRRKI
ncbi:hypothetical protein TrLO_g13038 [Triparma laevis f. longispina]|uniref:Uncharacterized protein n=1 Tax=Triparma laevis f. longispina TaxID=1714387 RepID=A0A9W6ZFH2_9STRA|nr:hypothetical protein TrLO_g13038 [Triparma laevis f. longispina]